MRRGLLPLLVLLALALTLGVGSAGGRSLATVTVTVQVIGKGTVTSSSPNSGIKCGNGKKACFLTFTSGTDITLTQNEADNWDFDGWDGCDTVVDDSCELDASAAAEGDNFLVTASFTGPATTQNTLSVSYDDTNGDGVITGPDTTGGISAEVDCGSIGPTTNCSWTALKGSTLTIFQAPDTGDLFTGWGGACSGTAVSCTVQLDGDQHVSGAWSGAADTAFLTVNITGSGKVNGSGINCPSTCSATEPLNSTVTLTATPSDGFTFTGWSGVCASSTVPTCTFTMTADITASATFTPANLLTVTLNGNGSVTGGSGAINCGLGATICSANFAANASVTLLATPGTGATFTGWTGACGGTATTCTVLMTEAKGVTAIFTGGAVGTGFQLSVSVSGNGRVTGGGINCGLGSAACSANQTANTTVTLSATPDSGATFTGWGGACSGTSTTCAVVMSSAKSVTATFAGGTTTVQLTVSVSGNGSISGGGISCGNGAFTCSASIALGSSVTLSASPASGAKFTGWGGSCSGTATTCSLVMSGSRSVTATFTTGATPGTLTIVAGGRGTVSTSAGKCSATGPKKTCVQHFAAGKKVALTATPLPGARFLGWGGDCSGQTTTCAVTLTTARTVSAEFSGGGTVVHAGLSSLGPPVVKRAGTGFRVTLRFNTTVAGLAHVRGFRAGRVATSVSFRVAAGRAVVGPFPVAKGGLYAFQLTLGGRTLRWTTCLGRCGAAAPGPPFLLTREPPVVTRSGDVWSVTLHLRANQIADDRVRAYRGTRLLVNQHFLGHTGRIVVGPFLLGPGSYTLRVTATDAYGRSRTLTWIVALAR